MPTCGRCGKPVGANDVTCPHCSALLAAYASPTGSGAAETYEAPPPPPTTEIPAVDLEVKPPSEADIVTDPTQVAEEAVSTAPRPLFDTYVTVEEIVKAAEGDHTEDVVTVDPEKVATKTVEFDVPDYAKPPRDAAPIPIVEDADAAVPLITRDSAPAPANAPLEEREDSEPEPEPEPATESWLRAEPPKPARQRPNRPARTQSRQSETSSQPVGQTDDYLRKLHQQAGYTASDAVISQPLAERRISPAERKRNREQNQRLRQQNSATAEFGVSPGQLVYVVVLLLMWLITIGTVLTGSFPGMLIFITIAMTWGFKPISKFISDMQDQ